MKLKFAFGNFGKVKVLAPMVQSCSLQFRCQPSSPAKCCAEWIQQPKKGQRPGTEKGYVGHVAREGCTWMHMAEPSEPDLFIKKFCRVMATAHEPVTSQFESGQNCCKLRKVHKAHKTKNQIEVAVHQALAKRNLKHVASQRCALCVPTFLQVSLLFEVHHGSPVSTHAIQSGFPRKKLFTDWLTSKKQTSFC